MAQVAALVLGDSAAHAGATYELASAGRYTAAHLGAIISTVLQRPIDVRQIDADTYLKADLSVDGVAVTHRVLECDLGEAQVGHDSDL